MTRDVIIARTFEQEWVILMANTQNTQQAQYIGFVIEYTVIDEQDTETSYVDFMSFQRGTSESKIERVALKVYKGWYGDGSLVFIDSIERE